MGESKLIGSIFSLGITVFFREFWLIFRWRGGLWNVFTGCFHILYVRV
jgi:hypothetical protein